MGRKRGIQPLEEPHIVKVIYDENGRVIGKIADNYVVKTQEEVDKILYNCGVIWGNYLRRKAEEAAMQAGPAKEV